MEQEVGAVLRIHQMVVEVSSGRPCGEKMFVNMRKVQTNEEMVREFETDLSCRRVTASRSQEGLVVMVQDRTCPQVVSLEYRGKDTNTQVEAGSYKHFIDVWLTNGGQEMVAGEAVFKKPAL